MSTQTIATGMMAWAIGWLIGRWVGIGSSMPRDRDWRRSFTHENTNRPQGDPPLRLQRTVRLDEGHVQRGNRSGASYQPKPQIDPKGQRRTPNPPPSEP
jgi:hypothetical protein